MKGKFNFLIIVLVLVFTIFSSKSFAKRNIDIVRYSGRSRYETAVVSSRGTFSSSRYVVIASGEGYADALVGGTLATQLKAPILLTGKDNISTSVLGELERLQVKVVFLLGGDSTISPKVYNLLISKGYKVERVFGHNRLETAIKVREMRFKYAEFITPGERIAVVDGFGYADSLSAAPFVGQMTPTTYLYPYVKGKMNSIPYYMAFGGTSSVPEGFSEKVRYSGRSRFETSVEVAKAYSLRLNKIVDTIVLVDGNNYPDALSSAPISALNNGAILLTQKDKLPGSIADFIRNNKNIKKVIIVGGQGSVSKNVEREISNMN